MASTHTQPRSLRTHAAWRELNSRELGVNTQIPLPYPLLHGLFGDAMSLDALCEHIL